MSFLLNPFVFAGAAGDFESIATVTVGSGGASSIEFTSIPGTYQHLQIRMIARSDRAQSVDSVGIRLGNGSIDTGSNYAWHYLRGLGNSVQAGGNGTANYGETPSVSASTATANVFGAMVIEILDYASTTKNKTVRSSGGVDLNGSGRFVIASSLWGSTNSIDAIRLFPNVAGSSDFVQHSTAALYGIKA